eukprot:scaffold323_cov232-Pinguiococcus_pyrenoidosus.AAC.7
MDSQQPRVQAALQAPQWGGPAEPLVEGRCMRRTQRPRRMRAEERGKYSLSGKAVDAGLRQRRFLADHKHLEAA